MKTVIYIMGLPGMERVLVIGSSGFLGRNVSNYLDREGKFEIHRTSRDLSGRTSEHYLDLSEPASIDEVIETVGPDVIINCAGIVGQVEDINLNARLTANLLTSASQAKHSIRRILISGSAAEYGYVSEDDIPVSEDTELSATQGYGLSKVKEEQLALRMAHELKLPVVIARIFNPIGLHMGEKFLISNVIKQLKDVRFETSNSIQVSRLDSRRDYIAVEDAAKALELIISGKPSYDVYNIGSGKATSNQEFIEMILSSFKIVTRPTLIQTSDIVEQTIAYKSDINRMKTDFNWNPSLSLIDAVERIAEMENDK